MQYGIYVSKDEILHDKIDMQIKVTYSSYIKVKVNLASDVARLCKRLNGMDKYTLCHVDGDYHLITFNAPDEELLMSLYRDIHIGISDIGKVE